MLPPDSYHRSKAFKATGRMSRCKECVRAYRVEYEKTDQYKEAFSEWWESRGKAWRLEYQRQRRRTPDGRAVKRKYDQSAKGKAANKKYTISAKGRAAQKAAYAKRMSDPEYRQKKREYWKRANKRRACKEAQKRYYQSPKGKAIKQKKDKAYKSSPAGLEAARRANTKRNRLKGRGTACTLTLKEWQAIKQAYGHRCAYCGEQKRLTQDHVIPLAKGGPHTKENVVPACLKCNLKKGTKTPTHFPMPATFG